MKKIIVLILIVFSAFSLYSQNNQITQLIYEGIKYHEQGKYKSAISKYQEAIDLDNNCSEAYYELSYSYFTMGNYDEAIKNAQKVIKLKKGNEPMAYVMLGNIFDLQGKYSKAVKTYLKAIKSYPQEQMLYYNLALTYHNHKEYQKAEETIEKSIQLRPTHASSHFLYSFILDAQGRSFQSTIPLYFAISLEPNSKRGNNNLNWLKTTLDYNITKEGNTINISINMFKDSSNPFTSSELMYKMSLASTLGSDSTERTDQEMFILAITKQMESLNTVKMEDDHFFNVTYLKPIRELLKNDLVEPLCYTISQSLKTDEVKNWIMNNEDRIEQFDNWLNRSLNGHANK